MTSPRLAAWRLALSFATLFALSLPIFGTLPDPGALVARSLTAAIRWEGMHLLGIDRPFVAAIVSDSTGMYIHAMNVLVVAALVTVAWMRIDPHPRDRVSAGLRTGLALYLALQLLRYGLDKIFTNQFYDVEPNLAFTRLGDLSRDILYWSTVGASPAYSIITGFVEVIAALLLVVERTRRVGAIVATAIMLHVVAINLGFDIGVKLFSLFLLFVSLLLAAPAIATLWCALVQRRDDARADTPDEAGAPASTSHERIPPAPFGPDREPGGMSTHRSSRSHVRRAVLTSLVVGLILVDAIAPHVDRAMWDDDVIAMHGAYAVERFVRNGDTIAPRADDPLRPRMVFVHHRGYLIVQSMDERMRDYAMLLDRGGDRLYLTANGERSIALDIERGDDDVTLGMRGILDGDTVALTARRVDLRTLPLYRRGFDWTSDDFR